MTSLLALCFLSSVLEGLGQTSPEILWKRTENSDRINTMIFSPDGNTLISGSSDRLINFWNAADGTLLRALNTGAVKVHESAIEWLAMTRDGSRLAHVTYRDVMLWRLPQGTVQVLHGHTDWVVGVSFSPDGSLLATASFDTTIKIWRTSDGTLLRTLTGHSNVARAVEFSPDGRYLATGAGDESVRIWNTSDWKLVTLLTGHSADIYTLTFSPDGSRLATGSYDHTTKIWRIPDFTLASTLPGSGNVYGVSFSPDGSTLATTDGEGNGIRLWRVADGSLIRRYTTEVNNVNTLAFSPSGLLGYGRTDGTVLLARVGNTPLPPPQTNTTVKVTSPLPNATFKAPAAIALRATPRTGVAITKVEFFADSSKVGESTSAPYTVNWNAVPAGNYSITAVDTDALGRQTTSPAIPITVDSSTPSTLAITLTSPGSGDSFPWNSPLLLGASVEGGPIARVEFFQNGTLLATDAKAPYSVSWKAVNAGSFVLTAVVTDTTGTTASSTPVTITVEPAPPESIKPKAAFIAPASGARVLEKSVLVRGSASDNLEVARVLLELNQGGFTEVEGTTSWSTNLVLVPGINTVIVKALDTSGNESIPVTRSFTYVVSGVIAVNILGDGTISPNVDGKSIQIGSQVRLRAIPRPGHIFAGWTGSVETNSPLVSTFMAQDTVLTANFIANPFLPITGLYTALISTNPPAHETSGYLIVTLSGSGAYSARLLFAGATYRFSGIFDVTRSTTKTIARPRQEPLTVTLRLLNGEVTEQIEGTLQVGTTTSQINGFRHVYHSRLNPAVAARYTLALNPAGGVASGLGTGYAFVSVDRAGVVKLSGSLPDGVPISAFTYLWPDGQLPLYIPLYKGSGSLAGTLTSTNPATGTDLSGTAFWTRPPQVGAPLYSEGLTQTMLLSGSLYRPVAKGVLALQEGLGAESGRIDLAAGNLEQPLEIDYSITPKTILVNLPNTQNLKLSFAPASGYLSGSFIHPATRKATAFKGVLLPKARTVQGFFLGPSNSGRFDMEPVAP